MKHFEIEIGDQITSKGTIDAFGLECLINRYFTIKRHIGKIERNINNCSVQNKVLSKTLLQGLQESRDRYIAR